ncbi:MAG: hypothetical protein R3C26_01930 [Calditrichia bacterium]
MTNPSNVFAQPVTGERRNDTDANAQQNIQRLCRQNRLRQCPVFQTKEVENVVNAPNNRFARKNLMFGCNGYGG